MSNSEESPNSRQSKNLFNSLKKIFGRKEVTFEESVSELIKEHDNDLDVHKEEKEILSNIVAFGDQVASDIMIPRTNIIAVPLDISNQELQEKFIHEGHTRLPVYHNSIDEIVGFIHIKDLFQFVCKRKKFSIKECIRQMTFVPGTIKLPDLLTRMKGSGTHIAIILDEHGGTDGLVTIEDVVEEIVGDIKDEHDDEVEAPKITKDVHGYIVDAKTEIEDVERELSLSIAQEQDEFDTIGGFVISKLGYIPKVGEKFSHQNDFEIEVVDSDSRKVKVLRITKCSEKNVDSAKRSLQDAASS